MKKITIATLITLALSATNLYAKDSEKMDHSKFREKMFEKSDKDNDGKISKQEWMSDHEERFVKMDSDKDGFLAEAELQSFHEKMRDKMRKNKGE